MIRDFTTETIQTILGVFNGEEAGKPFLGFCGEISVPPGSWGRTGWKPFFVSETA